MIHLVIDDGWVMYVIRRMELQVWIEGLLALCDLNEPGSLSLLLSGTRGRFHFSGGILMRTSATPTSRKTKTGLLVSLPLSLGGRAFS